MTIAELMAKLADYPPHLLVVMNEDSEGQGFRTLADVGHGFYSPASTWYGDFATDWDEEGEDEITIDESNAVCLWPTN